ncbi:MAG: hypothetical protein QNK36_21000 [Colwellia sp.]|nr:hypothetical protein [Colwellia sp.]
MNLQTRPEDLGKMGETMFVSLCKQAGLIANTSDDDKGGWDVEIESVRESKLNYSNHSYPVSRIQVKSSGQNKSKVRVEFSNLLNLIQYSGASFLIYFEYDSNNLLPDIAYLLEIDEEISRQVLVALRKRQISNKNFKLNKNKYTIHFHDKHKLESIDGNSFKQAVSKYIGSNYNDYVIRKINYLRLFEKETGRWGFSFSLDGDEGNIKNFVNACLGYSSEFKASSEMYSTIMGVKDDKNIKKCTSQNIKLSPVEKNLSLIDVSIGLEKHGKRFSCIGKYYSTPDFLPIELQKQRIKTDLFEVIFENKEVDGEIVVSPGINFIDIYNEDIIAPFRDFYLFLDMFIAAPNHDKFYLTIGDKTSSVPLEIKYTNIKLPDTFDSLYSGVTALHSKLIDLNLESEPILSSELLKKINTLNLFGNDYSPSIQFKFKNNLSKEKENKNIKSVNVVTFNSKISLINKELISIVSFFGSMKKLDLDTFIGDFNKSVYLKDFIFDKNNPDIDKLIEEEMNNIKEKYITDGYKPF